MAAYHAFPAVQCRAMATVKIRTHPNELPHAHLYLDDLEEISNILISAYKGAEGGENLEVHYNLGDTKMTTISDLEAHGGRTTKMRIELVNAADRWGFDRADINFNGFLNPRIQLSSRDDGHFWSAYSAIKAVFDARRYVLKTAITDLPSRVKTLAYLVFFILLPLVVLPLLDKYNVRGTGIFWAVFIAFAVLLGFTLFRPSRVSFVRSRDRWKATSESRARLSRDIILLLIGTAIGKGADFFISVLKHFFK